MDTIVDSLFCFFVTLGECGLQNDSQSKSLISVCLQIHLDFTMFIFLAEAFFSVGCVTVTVHQMVMQSFFIIGVKTPSTLSKPQQLCQFTVRTNWHNTTVAKVCRWEWKSLSFLLTIYNHKCNQSSSLMYSNTVSHMAIQISENQPKNNE